MRILIAVDGSAHSTRAVEFVAGHTAWLRADPDVHLLNVQFPIASNKARRILGNETVDSFYEHEARAALETAEKILEAKKIQVQSQYAVGQIAQEIDNYIRSHAMDLVVMGSQGQGAMENLVMGSVVSKVLALTKTPVLVIR